MMLMMIMTVDFGVEINTARRFLELVKGDFGSNHTLV